MKAVNKLKSITKKVNSIQAKIDGVARRAKKVKQIIDHPLESAGGAIGKKLGHGKIGTSAGKFLGRIVGTGDYTVTSNSLYTHSTTLSSGNVPQFTSSSRGIRITHREYLGDLIASSSPGAFKIQTFPINPGVFSTFPWFSAFATQFDEWRPNGIVAVVNSLSSSYSGTSSLGSVIIATDYDVLDQPYSTKIEMENSEFATSGNAATSLIHPLECNLAERPLRNYYTRSSLPPSTDSLRFYDFANLYVASQGCTANQVIGELWLSFDITLYKPQLYGSILGRSVLACVGEASTGIASNTPFGSNLTFTPGSDFTVSTDLTDLTFPSNLSGATFVVTLRWSGDPTNITQVITPVYTSGCSAGPILNSSLIGSSSSLLYTTGTAVSSVFISFTVKLNSPDGVTPMTVTLQGGTYLGNMNGLIMNIFQINPDYVTL